MRNNFNLRQSTDLTSQTFIICQERVCECLDGAEFSVSPCPAGMLSDNMDFKSYLIWMFQEVIFKRNHVNVQRDSLSEVKKYFEFWSIYLIHRIQEIQSKPSSRCWTDDLCQEWEWENLTNLFMFKWGNSKFEEVQFFSFRIFSTYDYF